MSNCFWQEEIECVEQCIDVGDFYEVSKPSVSGGGEGYGFQLKLGADEGVVGTYYGSVVATYRRFGDAFVNIGNLPASVNMSGGNVEALDISDDGLYAVWGAYASSYASGYGVGAVFFNNAGVWEEQQLLTIEFSGNNFGWAVAINDDGTVIAISDPSSFGGEHVAIWTRSGATWSRVQTLVSPLAPGDEYFGWSMVIHGDYMLVGGKFASDIEDNQGAVFAYKWSGGSFSHVDTLRPSDSTNPQTQFGIELDLHDDYAIIGAMGWDDMTGSDGVDGYIFSRVGDAFSEVLRLNPSTDVAYDSNDYLEGFAVAIGNGVAILGDIVGVDASAGNGVNPGKAWVYTLSGGGWALDYIMEASDKANPNHFGVGLGLSGDNLLIGSRGKNGNNGGLYYLTRLADPGEGPPVFSPTEVGAIVHSGAVGSGEWFGYRVDISGDYAISGANGIDKAYIMYNNGGTWEEHFELIGSDVVSGDGYGYSVGIDGDYAVVGSPGWNGTPGALYVFKRSGATWIEQDKLVGSDTVNDWELGYNVAIDGNTIVGSAPSGENGSAVATGVAYVFTRSVETWSEEQKIEPSITGAGDYFGPSIGLDADTLVIGDYGERAYVYTRTATVWTEQQVLVSNAPQASEYFGEEVSVSGDILITAGGGYNGGGGNNTGRVQLFQRSGGVWTYIASFEPAPDAGDYFSYGLDISANGDRWVAGAAGAGVGGITYVYARIPATDIWALSATLEGSDIVSSSAFGDDTAIDGDTVISGADSFDDNAVNQGKVYVHSLNP